MPYPILYAAHLKSKGQTMFKMRWMRYDIDLTRDGRELTRILLLTWSLLWVALLWNDAVLRLVPFGVGITLTLGEAPVGRAVAPNSGPCIQEVLYTVPPVPYPPLCTLPPQSHGPAPGDNMCTRLLFFIGVNLDFNPELIQILKTHWLDSACSESPFCFSILFKRTVKTKKGHQHESKHFAAYKDTSQTGHRLPPAPTSVLCGLSLALWMGTSSPVYSSLPASQTWMKTHMGRWAARKCAPIVAVPAEMTQERARVTQERTTFDFLSL